AIYMLFLTYRNFQAGSVETAVNGYKTEYTNTMQLKAQYEVLKDRQELKFAALDSLRAVSELLPTSATLEKFAFTDGKRLVLNGSIPKENLRDILEFDAALRRYKVKKGDGEDNLFDPLSGDNVNSQGVGANHTWHLSVELKRSEVR